MYRLYMHAHDLHMSLSCPLYPSGQQCDSVTKCVRRGYGNLSATHSEQDKGQCSKELELVILTP